jgi:hypothetical protein
MRIKRVVIAITVLLALAAGAAVVYFLVNPRSTKCYGGFRSSEDAASAFLASRDAGFDDTMVDERDHRTAVTFITGESGDDAAEIRERFATFLSEHDGVRGHPGDGCLETEAFGG